MRRLIAIALAAGFAITAMTSRAQENSEVGLLPSDKRAIIVPPTERNPFAKKEVKKPELEIPVEESVGEESQIIAVLNRLDVVGRTHTANGWKVLLGDLILENGSTLPPLIVGQTQTLRVVSIFDQMLEIEFVGVLDTNGQAKRIYIPISLAPNVVPALAGQSVSAKKSSPTVLTKPPSNAVSAQK